MESNAVGIQLKTRYFHVQFSDTKTFKTKYLSPFLNAIWGPDEKYQNSNGHYFHVYVFSNIQY